MAKIQVRFIILFLCVSASTVSYITRNNINIAIVSMVEDVTKVSAVNVNASRNFCPSFEISTKTSTESITEETDSSTEPEFKRYKWDQSTQGLILGAFFYTYILFQMPAGVLAEKFGGQWIVCATLLGSGLINVLTPFVTDYVLLVIFLRLVLGATQAGVYPASFSICCKWMPLKDRSLAFALLEGGACIGSIVAYFSSGFLSKSLGWPWVFFLSGFISLAFTVLLCLFLRSTPQGHPFITQEELMVIESSPHKPDPVDTGDNEGARPKIPWMKILCCKSVLVAALFKFAESFTFLIMASKLPAYLNDVMREDITSNGVINATMNILASLTMVSMGYVSERVIENGWMSRTKTRKFFSVFSGMGSGLCTLMIPFAGCNKTVLLAILFLGSILLGCGSGSDIPLPSEMSRNFPATIYSLLNMTAMSAGFIAPSIVGWILDSFVGDLRRGWALVFYLTSSVSITATVIFLCFASAERQAFDFIDGDEQKEEEEVFNPSRRPTICA
jgi:MFS family permease